MIFLLWLVAALLLVILSFSIQYHLKYIHLRKKFPYGAIYPILKFIYRLPGRDGAIEFFTSLLKEYGDNPVVCLYFNTYLLPTTPKLLEFVLKSPASLDKSSDYRFTEEYLGDGLLFSKGSKWKNLRKMMTPSFHPKMLKRYVESFDSKSSVLVEKLRPYVGMNEVEVFDKIGLFTLDVMCATTMGIQLNVQDDLQNDYVMNITKFSAFILKRILTHLRFDFIFRLSSYYKPYKQTVKALMDLSKNVVYRRKLALQNEQEISENECEIRQKCILLDALLKDNINGRYLTDVEIRQEVNTFMLAGHETTAASIGFCLYLLSKHPDIQERAYKEVLSVIGQKKDMEFTYSSLQKMKYLEQILMETIRLYPPAYVFSREINQDVIYEDIVLPKGLQVTIVPIIIHRNPEYYPEPEKFDPERFSPKEMSTRHSYNYLPFSAGPRNCIGEKFAVLEFKCAIAKVLIHYRILPAIPEHTVQLSCGMTLHPKNGIKIRLEERN